MPTKSAPTPPTLAQTCSLLQAAPPDWPVTAALGATAATESRKATTTALALAVTNSPLRVAWMPAGGIVERTRPPAAGRVAMVRHGIETSSACGAPDTSGAVMSLTSPSAPGACGQTMVAVVCFTGSSGTSPHSTTPTMPAMTAMSRATRWAERGGGEGGGGRRVGGGEPNGGPRGAAVPSPVAGPRPESRPGGGRLGVVRRDPLRCPPVPEPVLPQSERPPSELESHV